jgi:hypothetical protein
MSEDDKKFHEEQLKKVRDLKPVGKPQQRPALKPKPNFVPKNTVMRKAGRGR